MERLTKRINENITDISGSLVGFSHKGIVRKLIEKLAEYEDLEEQGLLLRLPLGVGDTFWELDQTWLAPHGYPRVAHSLQHVVYCMERLGKTTFLTEEAAKEAVAKLKGE